MRAMFITFLVTLGVFLLLAARKPIRYRLVIAFAAWQSRTFGNHVHSVSRNMEAKVPRGYKDVVPFGVIGIVVLLIVPPKEGAAAGL
jgi:hypothetical protein